MLYGTESWPISTHVGDEPTPLRQAHTTS